ncbi:hypothetical protein Ccrd_004904 [Cynara cardunculus var. scolymus]|uniref:G-protein beta WD-40 repeat-containing protein n=1 Tax=Cynara cardunculus var. scolymus TaxID=59895 RepID=A0A124SC88_CYNCS|nr:hypothetical protein Ccrd_004904 [Cynara cardunculus var. scolymus]
MDNSSENGWQRPSNRNPRSIPATTTIFSGEFDRNHATKLEKDFDPLEVKDVSLRQWLDSENRTVDPLECLHIFMQIVKIVSLAHSEGIIVHTVRPSCFVMSSFNDVSFIESVSGSDSDSGSDCFVDVTSCSQKSNSKPENALETCNSQLENTWSGLDSDQVKETEEQKHRFPMKPILEMETKCSSPEKNATMSNLRHRVFPPQLHLKWPKEAFFSMRLLHPDPASRPKIDEVLESELLKGPRQNLEEREAVIELEEKIVEQDMLLEFLLVLQKRRQEAADFLKRDVSFLTSDLKEVTKLQTSIRKNRLHATDLSQNNDSASSGSRKRIRTLAQVHNADESDDQENQENVPVSSRLMKNFKKLESAYFLTRHKTSKSIGKPLARNRAVNGDGKGSVSLETNSPSEGQIGWINPFLEGLSKYMSFSKLKVKADLKQGDLLNSSNLICSLGFDRDGEFFATAGVNKKIKVFEYDSILNENQDFHFPIVEIPTRSKLSKEFQVWDVTQNQVSAEMREHERRVWSVDFSADPTLLASGSDDGSGASIGTIRTKANVCCVQFPSDPGNFLAFGSADHRVYYYDLRNLSIPLCTLVGHNKTVSYIKFLDSTTLVSSSTDNTMKLWDLSDCTSRVLDCPIQTLTGHVNVKNFVGLSVSEGYIATGSETNEVVIYHKAFPMPALSYRFSTTDPISGNEVDDTEQFISSVCWRNQSNTLIAANSMGNIKILEMV